MQPSSLTVIIACLVILFGIMTKELLVALVFAVGLLLLTLATPSKTASSSSSEPDVQVQPIIVRRKYVGPESIYPKKMLIMTGKPSGDWWEYAAEAPGLVAEPVIKLLKKAIKGKGKDKGD